MLLPPLPVYRAEGLGVYAKTPDVKDHINRGSLTGERTESITWVCEQAGTWTLPDVTLQWWDPDTRQLKQSTVPGFTLEVTTLTGIAGNSITGELGQRDSRITQQGLLRLVSAVLLLAVLWYSSRRRFQNWFDEILHRKTVNEKTAFLELRNACRIGDAARAYQAGFCWLDQLVPGTMFATLTEFASSTGSPELMIETQVLQLAIVEGQAKKWNGKVLEEVLTKYRKQHLNHPGLKDGYHLPSLNPQDR